MRSFKYREADVIITLLGKKTGKISAVVKGARKPKSSMRGTVQLFNYGYYLLYRGKSLYTAVQCETLEPFVKLRENLLKFAYASYISEILTLVLPEEEVNNAAFDLLLTSLKIISEENEVLGARYFDINLMKISGFFPRLLSCVACAKNILNDRGSIVFVASKGGVLCSWCSRDEKEGIPVSRGTLVLTNRLSSMEPDLLKKLKIAPQFFEEMAEITRGFWRFILDRELKTLDFVDNVQDMNKKEG
ncbi:MAG: DNA repair protein RecO [Clostridia bacterium]|nr:DNA repair protein RecO [Clostridia bacterium]